jgi:hypothetical protein
MDRYAAWRSVLGATPEFLVEPDPYRLVALQGLGRPAGRREQPDVGRLQRFVERTGGAGRGDLVEGRQRAPEA